MNPHLKALKALLSLPRLYLAVWLGKLAAWLGDEA
jgi:hypothetical protein